MIGHSIKRYALAVLLLLGATPLASADTYTFIVQPILPPSQTAKAYDPLIKYLNNATGHTLQLKTSPNFLAYWQDIKKGQFHFVLDGAHLTDYRIKKMGYKPLVKVLDVVSYSLVTGPDVLVFEPSELVGKSVASLASPDRGALTIEQLFNHPIRQPILIEVTNAQDGIQKALNGEVSGAVIPTPLVGNFPQLNVVSTTDQWPHVALSASRSVPSDVAQSVSDALINASNSPEGTAMLSAINFPGFEKATPAIYDGYSDKLKSAWGY
ncbi:MAG: phosphate/phosphite/phosphonate ABC transporter substrate-binding protein [Gammaproteobacteria bacterium]|nr:phosphate/phosphite/phosphonate ABC transporter substrate-binding protein [Gammaproteobacteria bacterium]